MSILSIFRTVSFVASILPRLVAIVTLIEVLRGDRPGEYKRDKAIEALETALGITLSPAQRSAVISTINAIVAVFNVIREFRRRDDEPVELPVPEEDEELKLTAIPEAVRDEIQERLDELERQLVAR
jgi:hypothetical protein